MCSINQSIDQYIYNAPWYRGACYGADYAEAKRNVLSRISNVLTDGAVPESWTATEKRRAAVSKLCGGNDGNVYVNDRGSDRSVVS